MGLGHNKHNTPPRLGMRHTTAPPKVQSTSTGVVFFGNNLAPVDVLWGGGTQSTVFEGGSRRTWREGGICVSLKKRQETSISCKTPPFPNKKKPIYYWPKTLLDDSPGGGDYMKKTK